MEGDLVVFGINGTGAVLVHGNVTVTGGFNLNATTLVALLSTGDMSLTGTGSNQFFQGLVYCEGQ